MWLYFFEKFLKKYGTIQKLEKLAFMENTKIGFPTITTKSVKKTFHILQKTKCRKKILKILKKMSSGGSFCYCICNCCFFFCHFDRHATCKYNRVCCSYTLVYCKYNPVCCNFTPLCCIPVCCNCNSVCCNCTPVFYS